MMPIQEVTQVVESGEVIDLVKDIWEWAKPILTFVFMGYATYYIGRLKQGQDVAKKDADGRDEVIALIHRDVNSAKTALEDWNGIYRRQLEAAGIKPANGNAPVGSNPPKAETPPAA